MRRRFVAALVPDVVVTTDGLGDQSRFMAMGGMSSTEGAPDTPSPGGMRRLYGSGRMFESFRPSLLPQEQRLPFLAATWLLWCALLLLVRPTSWAAFGGQQPVFEGFAISRGLFFLYMSGVAVSCGLLTWAVLSSPHRWIRVCGVFTTFVPTLLAVGALRSAASLSKAIDGSSDDPVISAIIMASPIAALACGLYLMPTVAFGIFQLSPVRARQGGLLAFACAILPLVMYSLALLRSRQTLPTGLNDRGQPEFFTDAIVGDAFLLPAIVIYAIPFYAATTVIGATDQFGTAGVRIIERLRVHRVAWLAIGSFATAKVAYTVAGFTGRLPEAVGGSLFGWGSERSKPLEGFYFPIDSSWWTVAALFTAPALALSVWYWRPRVSGSLETSDGVVIAALVTIPGLVQAGLQWFGTVMPGPSTTVEDPLFLSSRTNQLLMLATVATSILYFRVRRPALAAAATFVLVLRAPGFALAILGIGTAVPNAFMIDLLASVVLLVVVAIPRWRVTAPPLAMFSVSLTLLLYAGSFLPTIPESVSFGAAIAFAPFWLLVLRAGPLNRAAGHDPSGVIAAVAFPATVAFVLWSLQLISGRWPNLDGESSFSQTVGLGLTDVAVPLLATMCILWYAQRDLGGS